MAEKYLGESIKNLGFGLMRLPMLGDEIDIEQTKRMVDTFMAKGFTYFDTAYVYIGGKSEVALKEAVVDRYPRDSFQCATKLPFWDMKEPSEMETVFQTSLDRAGLEYYDFYLLHGLNAEVVKKVDAFGGWDFVKGLKEQGRVKHIGFSFHDTAEVLESILHRTSGSGIRPIATELSGLGQRGRPVPQVLRGGPQVQQARHHHGTCAGRVFGHYAAPGAGGL